MKITRIEIIVETNKGNQTAIFIKPEKIKHLMEGRDSIQDFILDMIYTKQK